MRSYVIVIGVLVTVFGTLYIFNNPEIAGTGERAIYSYLESIGKATGPRPGTVLWDVTYRKVATFAVISGTLTWAIAYVMNLHKKH